MRLQQVPHPRVKCITKNFKVEYRTNERTSRKLNLPLCCVIKKITNMQQLFSFHYHATLLLLQFYQSVCLSVCPLLADCVETYFCLGLHCFFHNSNTTVKTMLPFKILRYFNKIKTEIITKSTETSQSSNSKSVGKN